MIIMSMTLDQPKNNMHMSILMPCVTCSFVNGFAPWVYTLVDTTQILPLFHN
jgi:hypothetical protein